MWINILIMYYLTSSYAEEILKFSIWQNIYLEKQEVDKHVDMSTKKINKKIQTSDLIFFAIIAWLGFSVIENVFYLVVLYFSDGKWLMMTLGRSVFATLLHIVATGLIAFFVIKKSENKKNNIWKYFVWILCGFGLHGIYNLSLFYNIKIVTILILLICYFILSYLLFNSDIIYQKK
jgi:RsiW-degrading membrane proteinase PrsW (M82 family)